MRKLCANCVQKQCANCVAKTALFVYPKRCCKVMQMNTLRMLPRARVNKQTNKRTNKQTNKTPIGVREKRCRKDEDEGRILRSHSFPFLADAKTKPLPLFFTNEQKCFSTMSKKFFIAESNAQARRRRRKITKFATFRVKSLFVSNLVRNFAM